jgi:hypothetical protein
MRWAWPLPLCMSAISPYLPPVRVVDASLRGQALTGFSRPAVGYTFLSTNALTAGLTTIATTALAPDTPPPGLYRLRVTWTVQTTGFATGWVGAALASTALATPGSVYSGTVGITGLTYPTLVQGGLGYSNATLPIPITIPINNTTFPVTYVDDQIVYFVGGTLYICAFGVISSGATGPSVFISVQVTPAGQN